ncbi:hypothetical protein KC711_06370 [Candidatus Peregrinibacteria bacterium]|nr:hypothetical protein [Candidatus Peregrinibacteria bacterium]
MSSTNLIPLIDSILLEVAGNTQMITKEQFCQFCLPYYARGSVSAPPSLSLFIDRYRVLCDQ